MKKALLFSLIALTNQTLFGQQDITLKSVIPPSPESSAFAKYGTYPCGTYTGRPDITIPIYEIKDGNLSVPISLSYDATGIRVNDMASWVGMNWSLNAGGMVSQMVVSQPDIIDTTIKFAAIPPRGSEIVNNATYFNYLQALVDGDVMAPAKPDAEPDRYFYSFNGRSGSFVFNRTRKIVQIPKTSLKIAVIGSMQGFKITDETGTVYIFNYLEKTESYSYSAAGPSPVLSANGSQYRNQTTGYYLTEIISNDGIQHIYFTYEIETTGAKDDTYSETMGPKFTTSQFPINNYHEYRWSGTNRVITIPRLKTISFSNGKVDFARVIGRLDDAGGSSRLDEITVYTKNAFDGYIKLKSFKFVQGYFYSSIAYAQNSVLPNQTADRYRLRLDTLNLKDATGTIISRYKFSYNSVSLPPKTSCSQDWWGYNNDKPNSTLVPSTVVPDGNGGSYLIGSADRTSVENSMKAGILEKITYPTGGYTIFETESHKISVDYSKVGTSNSVNAVGLSPTNLDVKTFVAPPMIENGSGTLSITIAPYGALDTPPFVKIKNLSTCRRPLFPVS